MLFNSLEFMLFFIIVTTLYFLLRHDYRWMWLLAASCFFYMAFIPIYILVLFSTILVDYFAAIQIEKSSGHRKKYFLVMSILSTCFILFVFKYFNFFNANIAYIAHIIHWNYSIESLSLILPIGLSFHTFQSLSYVIEVYRGRQKAEKHFGIYSLYVMFYPQLVAGPIERPQNLLHQFYERHKFEFRRVADGLKLMLWGLFKKVVIADRLSILVNSVFNDPMHHSGISLIVATIFFAFQIYCDFSGYSDMALGAAQVMGFKLMVNFKRPYMSKSISEFWSRWHISLSTWFRDYVYIPLGGNRVAVPRWYLNLFLVFLISGFWHGANWTFIVWGALHGFYLVFAIVTEKWRTAFAKFIGLARLTWLYSFVQMIITFILVCIGWVFFRANNISDAIYILTHMFPLNFSYANLSYGLEMHEFLLAVGLIVFLMIIQAIQERMSIIDYLMARPGWVRYPIYIIFILIIILLGVFNQSPFIYFQF